MNTLRSIGVWIILLFTGVSLQATTIRPYPNLGEMAKATETVVFVKAIENYEHQVGNMTKFRTSFRVLEVVKGNLQPGEEINVQHYRQKIGDLQRLVWGDLEVTPGKNYFLFLDYNNNGYWQPKMLSYGALEETERDGNQLLVPMGMGREVNILPSANGKVAEPLKVYDRKNLVELLSRVVKDNARWDSGVVETNYEVSSFSEDSFRNTNPDHCTNLSGTPYARWQNIESSTLPVWYGQSGDPGCSNESTQINQAINDLNNAYLGVNLVNAGTHSYVPSCSGSQGANGSEFRTWMENNLGGPNNILIQFNDPCEDIPNLSGCNGTLAYGGLYWYNSPYTWRDLTWRRAAFGYVVVNNRVGDCLCDNSDYKVMITHEITHCLNIGHISTSAGSANMNPSCCSNIQGLDIACLEFMYDASALPVELIDFTGKKNPSGVELAWRTATETNNDYFMLERSTDGMHYEVIAEVNGSGNSSIEQQYLYEDVQPRIGNNYYRLTQVDLDGHQEILEKVVKVVYEGVSSMQVIPNPVTNESFQLLYQSEVEGEMVVEIFNIAGQRLFSNRFKAYRARNLFNLSQLDLNEGVYVIRTIQGTYIQSRKFVKSQ